MDGADDGHQRRSAPWRGSRRGDTIEVDVVRDDEPRAVEVPDDLQAALDDDLAVRAGSASLFHSNQRRHVVSVATARTVETRERRIGAVLAELASGRRA